MAKKKKPLTEKQRKANRKANQKKYDTSPKGKASKKKYNQSPK